MDNVKILRFLGEDLVAEVISETADELRVKNPVRIVLVPNKLDPKGPSVGFAPFMEWSDDKEFTLNKRMYMCSADPLPVFLDQYKQQFSNLILPESSILTRR